MKILVLNGSPKGTQSNTYQLTTSFIEGLNETTSCSIDTIHVSSKNIKPCLGCFHCWKNTPGKCVIQDDMEEILQKYIQADLVIWSFPLYYFGMPSGIKALLDRCLPTNLPFIEEKNQNQASHPGRYDLSNQRHVLISTCGFHSTVGNYDALLKQFDIMFKHNYVKILCPEGELFNVPQLAQRTNQYLAIVKQAGMQYATTRQFSDEIQAQLNEQLYPSDQFMAMANASWGISDDQNSQEKDEPNLFLNQMAAIYNPSSYTKELTLEMHFTDINKTYQLLLQKDKCLVIKDNFIPYTTRIETPYDLWLKISANELSGSQALFDGMYKVLGNFDLMIHFDEYFGLSKPTSSDKKTNMTVFLFPFFAFWIFTSINQTLAGILAILFSSLVPLLQKKYKNVFYETAGAIACTIIGLLFITLNKSSLLFALPNFVFGSFWLISCFLDIPLCAYYSSNEYGSELAFKNPLFIKTNRILAFIWGVESILMSFVSLFISNTVVAPYWAIASGIVPAILMIFTNWFSKWYPAKVARGK